MTVSAVPGQQASHELVIFDTLVFGSTSSPTLWGRYAAWLGRSLACIDPQSTIQTYVDDPGFIVTGNLEEAAHKLTRLLLWVRVSGYPIKLEKAAGGKSMEWVGGKITLHDHSQEVEISILPRRSPSFKGYGEHPSQAGSGVSSAPELRGRAQLCSRLGHAPQAVPVQLVGGAGGHRESE